MSYKKYPKNKQEIDSFSGFKPKKELPKKTVAEFTFTTLDGVKHKMKDGNARIKIQENGGISCLLKIDDRWKPVQAKDIVINIKTVTIKREKK